MSDIVNRLRRLAVDHEHNPYLPDDSPWLIDAADEIERLRELVRLVTDEVEVYDRLWWAEANSLVVTSEQADLIRSCIEDGER